MNENSQTANANDDLKRKLVRRVAFAGFMIAMLLGALAFIDHLGKPSEEVGFTGPTFTAPVPVARKEISQPLKPAEPAPSPDLPKEVLSAPPPPVVEEATALPPVTELQSAAPHRPASRGTPSASQAARSSRSAAVETPAEGTSGSSQFIPEPVKPSAATQPQESQERRAPSGERQPPAPPRLFSGFAVQAGVFADAQHAEELRAKLTLNGIPSTMEARVQLGPFKTREEAEAARQKIKALGIDGILLPPKGAKR